MGSSNYSLQATEEIRQLTMSPNNIFQTVFPYNFQRKLAEAPRALKHSFLQHSIFCQCKWYCGANKRGEIALIYLLSEIQLQALNRPKCYWLILRCIYLPFEGGKISDILIHFYLARDVNLQLKRVRSQKEASLC